MRRRQIGWEDPRTGTIYDVLPTVRLKNGVHPGIMRPVFENMEVKKVVVIEDTKEVIAEHKDTVQKKRKKRKKNVDKTGEDSV